MLAAQRNLFKLSYLNKQAVVSFNLRPFGQYKTEADIPRRTDIQYIYKN
jgi:hypothetical protein